MDALTWARSVNQDLILLQQQTRIPALWAAPQMAHESWDHRKEAFSDLALLHHNWAGLKWAEWQAAYGCKPVRMGTWEVIDGERQDVTDAFCSCPDWATWLRVYAALLTGAHYRRALQYAADPLLYGLHVWRLGWATDPAYIAGVAGWMTRLWSEYASTIPVPPWPRVDVLDGGGVLLSRGTLTPDGRTLVGLREHAEAMGLQVGWDSGRAAATQRWPGAKPSQ